MSLDFCQSAVDNLEKHGMPYALVAGATHGSNGVFLAFNTLEDYGEHNRKKLVEELRALADTVEKGDNLDG